MSKRVRTLLRVSSRQQLHDDDIPIQRAEAQQFIDKQTDWEFDREYVEKAVSAYHNGVEDRQILKDIMQDAKNHEFEVLLAYMSDRIGRQEEYSFYVAELNRLGIEVWTIKDGQLKTEEHIDKLLNYIRFWQNEGESKKTGMRVHDTMMELVKQGRFVGGKAPFGYRLVSSGEISNHGRALKKLEIVHGQAEIVKKIYSYAVHQGYGFQKIANTLNEEKIPAPILEQWKSGTVRSILTNPIYMGYPAYGRRKNTQTGSTRLDRKDWTYSDEQMEELVIVPQDLWERAQEIREARKAKINCSKETASKLYEEKYHVPFTTKGRLALTGLVYCGYCGAKLKNAGYANHWTCRKTGEEKVSYVGRYGCPNHCKQRTSYAQDYLETIVFDTVKAWLKNMKKTDVSAEIQRMQEQKTLRVKKELKTLGHALKSVEADIRTMEEKIPESIRGEYVFPPEQLSRLIQEKEQKKQEIAQSKADLEKQMQEANTQKEELEQIAEKMPEWDQLFEEADVQTKRMILSTLMEKMIVRDDEIVIKFKIR